MLAQFNEHSALEKGYSKASVAAVQAGLLSAAQTAQRHLASIGKWGETFALGHQPQPPALCSSHRLDNK